MGDLREADEAPLPNRALFSDRVGHALSRRRRERLMPAVLFLDLDDFKTVNDTLGHGQGDRLLVEVARRTTATRSTSRSRSRRWSIPTRLIW